MLMKTEDATNLKWNQHPVIATVLWILGTDATTSANLNKSTSGESEKSNAVVWKDETGGSISEYFNQIQPSSSMNRSEAVTTDLPVQLGNISLQQQENNPSISNPLAGPAVLSSGSSNGTGSTYSSQDHYMDNENGVDINASPQWGFYVPITPPQQEMFVKHERITIQSIQHDQRVKPH